MAIICGTIDFDSSDNNYDKTYKLTSGDDKCNGENYYRYPSSGNIEYVLFQVDGTWHKDTQCQTVPAPAMQITSKQDPPTDLQLVAEADRMDWNFTCPICAQIEFNSDGNDDYDKIFALTSGTDKCNGEFYYRYPSSDPVQYVMFKYNGAWYQDTSCNTSPALKMTKDRNPTPDLQLFPDSEKIGGWSFSCPIQQGNPTETVVVYLHSGFYSLNVIAHCIIRV